MQADYSVELEPDDPVLEIPWHSADTTVRYYDLRGRPDLVPNVPEAQDNPELAAFLIRINTAKFSLQTAKCDAWSSHEISAEEEIFGAKCKFTSYIDLLFVHEAPRTSFGQHEALAKKLCDLLHHVPEMAAAVELVIRRCVYHLTEVIDQTNTLEKPDSPDQVNTQKRKINAAQQSAKLPSAPTSGFYITAYVSGFGDNEEDAGQSWSIALKLLQYALVQLCNG